MKREYIVFILILLAGLILRMWFLLNASSLTGDEFYSLEGAQFLWRNPHAISYFFLLHWWMKIFQSDIGVRFLSFAFGILSIPFVYLFGREFLNKKSGMFLAAYFALAPWAIHFSIQVRFYSLFLFWSIVSLWLFFSWLNKKNKFYLSQCFISNIFVISTHLAGFFLPYIEFLYWAIKNKKKLIFSLVFFIPPLFIIFLILIPKQVLSYIWAIVMWLTYGEGGYGGARGLSFSEAIKIMFMFYNFLFGEGIYPYTLLVGFILSFAIYFAFCGFKTLFNINKQKVSFFILALVYLPFIYFFLSIISSKMHNGFQPRYGLFLLPIFLALYVMNISARIKFVKYFSVFFMFVALSLGIYHEAILLKTGLNWRQALSKLNQMDNGSNTTIFHDGRSTQALKRYLKPALLSHMISLHNFDFQRTLAYNKIYIVSNTWDLNRIKIYNELLKSLPADYRHRLIYYCYPTTIYGLDLSPWSEKYNVIRPQLMPIEFQDIPLPIWIRWKNKGYRIDNCVTLDETSPTYIFKFSHAVQMDKFLLISNLSGSGQIKPGELIGEIILGEDNKNSRIPMRYGRETLGWMEEIKNSFTLSSVYEWHKKIAFIGRWGYPQKYKDSLARIYASDIVLNTPSNINNIQIQLYKKKAKLHLWGLFLSEYD